MKYVKLIALTLISVVCLSFIFTTLYSRMDFGSENIVVGHYYVLDKTEDPFDSENRSILLVLDKKDGYVKFRCLQWANQDTFMSTSTYLFSEITEPLIESNK